MWILSPSLSSAFAAASGCSMKRCTSRVERVLWPTLNGKPSPRPFSWPGWRTRPWSLRLFGAVTCENLTPDDFAVWWTSSLQGCRASLTPSPESNEATRMIEAGEKMGMVGPSRTPSESLRRVSPPWCSSKTLQLGLDLEISGFDPSVMHYADWVTRSKNRCSLLRKTLEHRTSGSVSSSWPTVRANDAQGGEYMNQRDGSTQPTLTGAAQNWPSPRAEDSESCGNHPNAMDSLTGMVKRWATPQHRDYRSPDLEGSANLERKKQEGWTIDLNSQAVSWPTPNTGNGGETGMRGNVKSGRQLHEEAQNWPTPSARDMKGENGEAHLTNGTGRLHLDQLPNFVKFCWEDPTADSLLQDHESCEPGQTRSEGPHGLRQRLNPAFTCWLMGWPWWWTHPAPISFAAAAMVLWRSRARSLLWSLCGEV
jgi:hypothetical protein